MTRRLPVRRLLFSAVLTPMIVAVACSEPAGRSLTLSDVRVEGGRLSFTLTNRTSKRITACTLEVHSRVGREERPLLRWTTDWYNSAATANSAPLQPRQWRRESIPSPPSLKADAAPRLVAVAVIFDDLSSSGEPSRIEAILRRRFEDRRALTRLFNQYTTAVDLPISVPAASVLHVLGAVPIERRSSALRDIQVSLAQAQANKPPVIIADLRKTFAAARAENGSDLRAVHRLWTLYEAALRHTKKGD